MSHDPTTGIKTHPYPKVAAARSGLPDTSSLKESRYLICCKEIVYSYSEVLTYRGLICVVEGVVHLSCTPAQLRRSLLDIHTHKAGDQTGLSDTLLAQKDQLELLQRVVRRGLFRRGSGCWTLRHGDRVAEVVKLEA